MSYQILYVARPQSQPSEMMQVVLYSEVQKLEKQIAALTLEIGERKSQKDELLEKLTDQVEQIAELTESRDDWKRQWRLMEAAEKQAELHIAMLSADNKRLREDNDWWHYGPNGEPKALRGEEVKDEIHYED